MLSVLSRVRFESRANTFRTDLDEIWIVHVVVAIAVPVNPRSDHRYQKTRRKMPCVAREQEVIELKKKKKSWWGKENRIYISPMTLEVLCSSQDPFFEENMYSNFGDLGSNIKECASFSFVPQSNAFSRSKHGEGSVRERLVDPFGSGV